MISEIQLSTIVVIGRPNVGKSTLVNRIIGRRQAIVEDTPGVTRDIISYLVEWGGTAFNLVDTGGWDNVLTGLAGTISKRSENAVQQADVVLFVLDARVGITTQDELIGKKLIKTNKPILLVANKVDNEKYLSEISELWSLGFGAPFSVSAANGAGVADLLDVLIKKISSPAVKSNSKIFRKVALVGKPNVGKSSLLNKLTGKTVALVDNKAGTTIDPVDSLVSFGTETYWQFVDTAGLKKKINKIKGFEYYAFLRTKIAIELAEVVLVLISADIPITEQDVRIINSVVEAGRALVLGFNKWDLVDDYRQNRLNKEIATELAHVLWAPKINISALSGKAVVKLEKHLLEALVSWKTRISTGKLNNWLQHVVNQQPPPAIKGKVPKILFATQANVAPPTFVFFTTGFLENGYLRFLERKLRETFGFFGSPIKITAKIRSHKNMKS